MLYFSKMMEASEGYMKLSRLSSLPYQEKSTLTYVFKKEIDEELVRSPTKV